MVTSGHGEETSWYVSCTRRQYWIYWQHSHRNVMLQIIYCDNEYIGCGIMFARLILGIPKYCVFIACNVYIGAGSIGTSRLWFTGSCHTKWGWYSMRYFLMLFVLRLRFHDHACLPLNLFGTDIHIMFWCWL